MAIRFEGHAIVSADDKIADAGGAMPKALHHPEDWARFQAALDRAVLIVLGRRSHEAVPDRAGRRRLVMSRSASGLEQRSDRSWWWNPEGQPLDAVMQELAPQGGTVAVTGGKSVFDYFLTVGFDAFHLSRVAGYRLPGGVSVFSACEDGTSAEAVLDKHGLIPREHEMFDRETGVSVTVWRKWG